MTTSWTTISNAVWKARYSYKLHNRILNNLNYLKETLDAIVAGTLPGGSSVANVFTALGIVHPYKGGGADATLTGSTAFSSTFARYNDLIIDTGAEVAVAGSPQILVCNKLTLKGTITADGKGANAAAGATERIGGFGAMSDYYLGTSNAPVQLQRILAAGGQSGFNGEAARLGLTPLSLALILAYGLLGGGGGGGGGCQPGVGSSILGGTCGCAGDSATGRAGGGGGSGIAGGGGGGDAGTSGATGTGGIGGKGGGIILIYCNEIAGVSGGTITAKGTAGGDASGDNGGGGGGGGGGLIALYAITINYDPTNYLIVTGGGGGLGIGNGMTGNAGGAGAKFFLY